MQTARISYPVFHLYHQNITHCRHKAASNMCNLTDAYFLQLLSGPVSGKYVVKTYGVFEELMRCFVTKEITAPKTKKMQIFLLCVK